jgi:hypothetical protein
MLHIAGTWRGNPPFVIITVAMDVAIAIAITITIAIAVSVAVAVNVTVAYHRCHCRCHWQLLSQLLSPITAAISFALLSAIVVTIALAVGHCRLRHHQQPQSPFPLDITAAVAVTHSRELLPWWIVFKQFEQIILALFYFVQTVGGALIKAEWLTRHHVAMANTSVGQQGASSKRLIGEVAGSRGAAGWRHCLWMGGVVWLGCWVACHWQMAFVMMCWMW